MEEIREIWKKKARLKKEIREKGKENVANFGVENNSLDSGKWQEEIDKKKLQYKDENTPHK